MTANLDILEKFLQDWGYGNSILIGDKEVRCYVCDREFNPKEEQGGILIDNFLSDWNPGRLKFFCSFCWWRRSRTEGITNILHHRLQTEVLHYTGTYKAKRALENKERKEKGAIIYHAEKAARRWFHGKRTPQT